MNRLRTMSQVVFFLGLLLVIGTTSSAQEIGAVQAVRPAPMSGSWTIDVAFREEPTNGINGIKEIHLENVIDSERITLSPTTSANFIYSYKANQPLELKLNAQTNKLELAKRYQVIATMANNTAGKPDVTRIVNVVLNEPSATQNKTERVEAKSVDSSDVYVSGELNGAHRRKTDYATKIKLQKPFLFNPNRLNWRHMPFFKLDASTDPDADPDKMEIGWTVDYVANHGVLANTIKLESERDFDNTNVIYDTRFTYLVTPFPKGADKRVKVFLNPFIGGEFGKNLKSPLKAAERDGIARVLAGSDLRLGFFLKPDSDEPEINWTTTYERRWLLTNELSFETNKDGTLKLRTFGKSPRDYVSSKVSYQLTKFFETFLEYEWGQEPPSYKLVDHRFRLGFAYKFKFGVK